MAHLGIRVAKLCLQNMRFFPEPNYKKAELPILERFGTPELGVKLPSHQQESLIKERIF
jgi:hypothetical protein